MPVRWTPEVDRLLLLKLIETHGISVNSQLIVNAWPDDNNKPTARAITERFVKLRQLAGIKVSVKSSPKTPGSTRNRTTNFKTPTSSANKRRRIDEVDESESLSDQPTPTHKTGSVKRGLALNNGFRVKQEPLDNDVDADRYDSAYDHAHNGNGYSNGTIRDKSGSYDTGSQPEPRQRIARSASQRARNAWAPVEDDEADASGERPSEEDSAGSEYAEPYDDEI